VLVHGPSSVRNRTDVPLTAPGRKNAHFANFHPGRP
jgi:hypothetical protein